MNAKTLKALRGSIAKWRRIVDKNGPDFGGRNCPLCEVFSTDGNWCEGCPVAEKSGHIECGGTPYDSWTMHGTMKHPQDKYPARVNGCPTCLKHAKAELKFLEGLVP